MTAPQVVPYGSWKSPITSDLIVAATVSLDQVVLDGEDVYWVEGRPWEEGRNVIVKRTPDGRVSDVTAAPFNARTRVHEYGGGSYTVVDGVVYFAHFNDQRLYCQGPGEAPVPLSPQAELRFADAAIDRRRHRLVCVREDHRAGGREAVNTLVHLALAGNHPGIEVVTGNDFYSSPCLSPDGKHLAWLTWNHPNMPWDGTELWVGEFNVSGGVKKRRKKVAGGPEESLFQPQWSPDGILYFVSDRSGWWNLYRWRDGQVEAVCPRQAEFGRPQWLFSYSTYAFASADQIFCTFTEQGAWRLATLDTRKGTLEVLDCPYTEINYLRASADKVVFIGGSPTEALAVVRYDLASRRFEVLRRSSDQAVDPGYLSVPRAIEFPTEGGKTAHAFFYPPVNRDFVAPDREKPPLVVRSHGGPTSATSSTLKLDVQFWTSRGIAVLDVNYGGSTGYGRAYRQRLDGAWGLVDVDDCVNGAKYLVGGGEVDGGRLAVRGGSAGGYTTLCALTFRDLFRAGASYYGVSDLEALTKETHKFESRYLDRLVGPYPQRRDLYRERSPIHFTERLSCPVILFQGLEDKVVLPNQAEMMVDALRAKGLPVAYVPFEGEQHGFRRAANIKRALDSELYFYSRIFGFGLADPVEPVPIENLPPA
ncbi:MAG: S9 family peptidase [Planctomycetes bacterium]|nr:S9 family peptidase [Planctomycetota bacterium]